VLFGIYGRPDNPYLSDLADGTKTSAHRYEWRRAGVFTPDQVEAQFETVAVYGLQGRERIVRDAYAARGVPVLVLDAGYCGDEVPRVGVWWHDMSWFPLSPSPGRNAFTLEPRRAGGERILVCGQKPGDAQHELADAADVARWARETTWRLRAVSDRPVHWRPHPASAIEIAGAERDRSPSIEAAIADAFAVVTYNSTSGTKALAAGVPVLCSPRANYAPIANTDLADAADPSFPTDDERAAWFDRLAGLLWSRAELADGSCLDFMLQEEVLRAA